MPPLLILAAVGTGAMIGYRVLKAALAAQARETGQSPDSEAVSEPKDLGSLVLDAESGVYKPRT